jgi:putative multiple sugar transport system permease protein
MTLVIVIRHIDLSVGFLAGFLGAVAAIALTQWNLPVFVVIPLVMALGIVAGLVTAFPVAQMGIPSFVASLAGWLIYRGLLLLVTLRTGTIIIPNDTYNAIGNGFIPDFPEISFLPGMHKITLLIGVIAVILNIVGEIKNRKNKIAYNFEVVPMNMFIVKLIVISAIILGITWVLAGYNGLSWTVVIMLAVVMVYHYVTTKTVLGRYIYAIGGNPEAAELSGIDVKKMTFMVFGSMGMMAALSGILFSSRLQSATTTAGSLFEMDAIAAAYIGGVSAAGGVGKVTGSLIGALVMTSLTSGMNLMGIDISSQYVVRGMVLLLAVIFDVATRRASK